MIGIGIGIAAARPAAGPWWPAGATFAADFVARRYMRDGDEASAADAFAFTRATPAWDHAPRRFAPGEPRFTQGGLILEDARQRLSLFPASPLDWNHVSGAPELTPLPPEGPFFPVRIASDGNVFARIVAPQQSFGSGDIVSIRARYRAGTSGRLGLYMRDDAGGDQSIVEGPAGALAPQNNSAGIWSDVVNLDLGGGLFEVAATIKVNATSSSWRMGCSPRSTTPGDHVDLLGCMNALEARAGTWILGDGSAPAGQDAERLTLLLPPGPANLAVAVAGGTIQIPDAAGPDFVLDPHLLDGRSVLAVVAMPA